MRPTVERLGGANPSSAAAWVDAHGLHPGREGKSLYAANRASNAVEVHRKGSVSAIAFQPLNLVANGTIAGGGGPNLGNASADGKYLWLSGRYDDVVYRFDTRSGAVDQIKVSREPHGLTVWPQPGRYSLGHTGNLR